jgi:hypothetical protein
MKVFSNRTKTQIVYSYHGSLAEHPHLIKRGACSIPGKYNIFKFGLSPSQDENAGLNRPLN